MASVTWVSLAARGATLTRLPGPARVVEEEPYPLRVELRTGLLPPPGGELIEPLLGWPVAIGGRWSRKVRINVRFSRRGRWRLEPGRLVIHDPLRLHVREVVGNGDEEVMVLPRVEPVTAPGGSGAALGEQSGIGSGRGLSGRRIDASSAELEIDGLRAYREGSPASRIHWPTVARRGEMMERRMVAELDSAPLVVLDCSVARRRGGAGHGGARGGLAVRAPGSDLGLRHPASGRAPAGGDRSRHGRMARACTCASRWPGSILRLRRGRLSPRSGAVLWVTAAALRRSPRALERLPAGARYVVSPGEVPGGAAAFEVAGCTGYLLGRGARRVAA